MDTTNQWLELSVKADSEAVEAVGAVLARYGHQRGIVIEEAQRPADDGISLERDPAGPAVVRTYLPHSPSVDETLRRIEVALDLLGNLRPISPLRVRTLAEEDWADAWREHFSLLRVGKRIVVVPAWQRYRPRRGEIKLILDPGMAFGTGLHPTTQLCLGALERYLHAGMRVLDLGTGSGILAIAAAKLGSGPVLALDTDPVAVEAAGRNVRRNRLARRVTVQEGTLGSGMGPFDLIVANLVVRTIQELAGLLAGTLAPEGLLVASGILVGQGEDASAAVAAAGLREVERPQQGEWIALVAQR
jgi:ribosomal protein L11 methyltransferase